MTQKLTISTVYCPSNDSVAVEVYTESMMPIMDAFLNPQSFHSVNMPYLSQERMSELPVVNEFHLLALVLSALVERTTDETDIPLVVETFQLTI